MTSTAVGVLTSGGDAPGMNAAVRAVVRLASSRGARAYAICEGYQGLVEGGPRIRELGWGDVGGILQLGGTVVGTARCEAFKRREGRLAAARNLARIGLHRLVIIGGDGSLTGADLFRREWSSLIDELVATGQITREAAEQVPFLAIAGLVGSIDNDMAGTDMTIGADTALHRISEALDALRSTAASHQRAFVVEVMGRHCGYLALMGAVASGADYVLIPENPPPEGWEEEMCNRLRSGRAAGRRESIVVVAEGARDRAGCPIESEHVRRTIEDRLGEDTRVTVLGHVQRGGPPSAFDRWMATLVGVAAAEEVLAADARSEPKLIGMRHSRIERAPLMACVETTRAVGGEIERGDYANAMRLRGGSFAEMVATFEAVSQSLPTITPPPRPRRLALVLAGSLAPGMNTAAAIAARLALDRGHAMLGVRGAFEGLTHGSIDELSWGSVGEWIGRGGAALGTNRFVPSSDDLGRIAENLERHAVSGLVIVGGSTAYESARRMHAARSRYPALAIPTICIPATINNDLPGSELSIGADSALDAIVEALDRIKQSAVAERRCFVVEVMGRRCGYLALMSALASGAEQVYLPEEGMSLAGLEADVARTVGDFRSGKRLSLIVRNENAHADYTLDVLLALYRGGGEGLYDVRHAVLGHLTQGGDPSPYDRIQATRLAARAMRFLDEEISRGSATATFVGFHEGRVVLISMEEMAGMLDRASARPWWLELRSIARLLSGAVGRDAR